MTKALGTHGEIHAMDTCRFDELTRTLAATGSRRRVVAALAGGLFAAWGGRRVGATDDKVSICHRTSSDANEIVLIEVSGSAVADHLAHGDVRYAGCCRNGDCGGSQACVDGSCQDTCLALGATCNGNNECCQIEESEIICDVATCGGTHCCRIRAGSCSNDCDCCAPLVCNRDQGPAFCDNDPGDD